MIPEPRKPLDPVPARLRKGPVDSARINVAFLAGFAAGRLSGYDEGYEQAVEDKKTSDGTMEVGLEA